MLVSTFIIQSFMTVAIYRSKCGKVNCVSVYIAHMFDMYIAI